MSKLVLPDVGRIAVEQVFAVLMGTAMAGFARAAAKAYELLDRESLRHLNKFDVLPEQVIDQSRKVHPLCVG